MFNQFFFQWFDARLREKTDRLGALLSDLLSDRLDFTSKVSAASSAYYVIDYVSAAIQIALVNSPKPESEGA